MREMLLSGDIPVLLNWKLRLWDLQISLGSLLVTPYPVVMLMEDSTNLMVQDHQGLESFGNEDLGHSNR